MKMADYVTSVDIRFVTCFIYLLYFTGSWVHGTSDLGHHADPLTHCQPKRRETIFPVVSDAAQNTTTNILSQPTPSDLLHVSLKWRRQSLTVVLYKDDISSPATVSESMDEDVTTVEVVDESCSYQGRVRGQDSSTVALTTCNGLSGYIQTNDELLFIQPQNDGHNNAHLIYTCESRAHLVDTSVSAGAVQSRLRRSSKPTKYVEVQVVVDHTVVRTAGSRSKATTYVLTLMNIANTAYQHNSLDQNIQVAVVKIVFLSQNQQREVFRLRQPGETITLFCEWSVRNRGGQRYDLSMLITEDDFGHSGYAPVGVMCRQDQNCFAVRDEGFTSGFVIAHEMGHAFGLNHDGQDNSCSGTKYKRTIMSPVVVSTFNHFWWSECSKRSLANLMRSLHCLDNTPKSVDNHYRLTASQELEEDLGIAWSLDYQCRKDFGKDYEFCKAVRGDPCNELVCNKKGSPRDCFTRHGIPLPGTNCGESKKCFNATCVEDVGEPGTEVDGTWSEWTSWTACNRECGVGIKRRSRSCQFPANARKGNECEGEANAWSTCVNYTCTTYKDTRAEECSKWEKSQGTTKWLPFEANNASLKCQQTCKALPSGAIYVKQQNVADGTPCSYMQESSDICMDGSCIKVGCDGELDSSKTTDLCGTCDGDGSLCKTIKTDYVKNSPSVRRYLKVLRIPAGARHISVKKNSDGYSFLALKDGRRGTYFLNGNRKYVQFAQIIHNGAMFYYTHGNSTHLEMFITPGPLASPVDVMIYVGARRNTLAITYNFTVGKDDNTFENSKFKWKFEAWSECSVTCGSGTKQTVYACYDKDSNGKVDDEFCSVLRDPRIDTSGCSNPRCPKSYSYRWEATDSWTDCNAECDQTGTQTRIYQCQKMDGNRLVSDVEADLCNGVQKDDETKECSGPQCSYTWEIGVWSECSVTCGRGSQQRDVFCGDPATDEDDTRCQGDPPSSSKSCDIPLCNVNRPVRSANLCLNAILKTCEQSESGIAYLCSIEYIFAFLVFCNNGFEEYSVYCQRADDKRALLVKSRWAGVNPFTDSSGTECRDKYIFCSIFPSLEEICGHETFRRKCCRTCRIYG